MSHTHRGVKHANGRVEGIVPADSVITARIPAGASVVEFDVPDKFNPRARWSLPDGATTLVAVAARDRSAAEKLADAKIDSAQAARCMFLMRLAQATGVTPDAALVADCAAIDAALGE